MSFEEFPADAVQQFNDPGPFYVQENGKLRSPPGLGPRTQSLHGLLHQPINLVSPACTSNGSECTPRKLYDMTLDFVAANITLVESLVGFPEVVGQQLFHSCHRHGSLSLQALRLFSDAYGDTILRSLNLQGHHLVINEHHQCLVTFPYLSELEVGSCGMGDDHEILPLIANWHSLRRLGLASNSLSDVGVQRLTTPLRVLGRGPRNLAVLDLAGNNCITDKSAGRYLTAFTSLKAIDLSGCSVTSVGLDVLKTKLKLKLNTSCSSSASSPFHPPIQTVGWASPLVEQWKDASALVMQRAKGKASEEWALRTSKANLFYGRAQKRMENVSRNRLPKTKCGAVPVIQLITAAADDSSLVRDRPEQERVQGGRFLMGSREPAACHQKAEGDESVNTGSPQSALEEELIGQYTPRAKEKLEEKECMAEQQSRVHVDSEERNQFMVQPGLVRVHRPPPRKRIKLCRGKSKGFTDVLQDPITDDGKVDLERYKESAHVRRSSDQTSLNENQMVLKGKSSRLYPTKFANTSERRTERLTHKCKPTVGGMPDTRNCEASVCTGQENKRETSGALWDALHSQEWG